MVTKSLLKVGLSECFVHFHLLFFELPTMNRYSKSGTAVDKKSLFQPLSIAALGLSLKVILETTALSLSGVEYANAILCFSLLTVKQKYRESFGITPDLAVD